MELKTGILLQGGKYKIVKRLGDGSFGITYLASVNVVGTLGVMPTNTFVAIKEFYMKGINGREGNTVTVSTREGLFYDYKTRFIKEAQALSKLSHTNIVKVMDLFEENNTAYYAMEYIDGGSLDNKILETNGLSEDLVVKYVRHIGEALSYLHSHRMLHLDLKPNNIMLQNEGNAILIDFGLAKQFDANGHPETSTTIGHGTPGYAPIEQANYREDNTSIFPATMDIYAFGATIFKMVTGHRPPEASIMLNEGFPEEDFVGKSCSEELKKIIKKALSPLKKDRYQSVGELLHALPCNTSEVSEETEKTVRGTKGFFKRKIGEREYGTYKVIDIPVTDTINEPESVRIKVWSKEEKGISYEFIISDACFDDGFYSLVRSWVNGSFVDEHEFSPRIPLDVREFLHSMGFLSNEHWEKEEGTTPIGDNFGYDVSIELIDKHRNRFVRRVENAAPGRHDLLLNAVESLVRNSSLNKELKVAYEAEKKTAVSKSISGQKRDVKTELFKLPSNTIGISVSFESSRIGGHHNLDNDFCYRIGYNGITPLKVISAINALNIEVGPTVEDCHDYSEVPARLELSFESTTLGTKTISLVAFNTDMQGGNIYNANIGILAKALKDIVETHNKRKSSEPTAELVHCIPDTVKEIHISYCGKGGLPGTTKAVSFAIGENKSSIVRTNASYICDKNALDKLISGLREMQLPTQSKVEITDGYIHPQINISLYDNNGKLIKNIEAIQTSRPIGNVSISVDQLKSNLEKISPVIAQQLSPMKNIQGTEDEDKGKQEDKEKQEDAQKPSFGNYIGMVIVLSFFVGALALIPYFMNYTDAPLLEKWMLPLGVLEFSLFFFCIESWRKNRVTEKIAAIGFFTGFLSFCWFVFVIAKTFFNW